MPNPQTPGASWASDLINYQTGGGPVPDYNTYGDIDPEIIQRILRALYAQNAAGLGQYRSDLSKRRENDLGRGVREINQQGTRPTEQDLGI